MISFTRSSRERNNLTFFREYFSGRRCDPDQDQLILAENSFPSHVKSSRLNHRSEAYGGEARWPEILEINSGVGESE